jgi:hypothetical protein
MCQLEVVGRSRGVHDQQALLLLLQLLTCALLLLLLPPSGLSPRP